MNLQTLITRLKSAFSRCVYGVENSNNLGMDRTLAFFAWYGGADIHLLKKLPRSVQTKRAAFGATMLAVLTATSLIAATVWSDIIGPVFGICTAIVWFWIITTVERAIIKFIDHDNAKNIGKVITFKAVALIAIVVAVRILLVYTISSFNARMMEMQVFRPEIMADIASQRQIKTNRLGDSVNSIVTGFQQEKSALAKNVDLKNAIYQNAIAGMQKKIDNLRDSTLNQQNRLSGEIEGLVGSGLKGYGPAATAKQQALTRDSDMLVQMQASLDASKHTMPEYLALQQAIADKNAGWSNIDAQIAEAQNSHKEKAIELKTMKLDGFNDRFHALERLAADSALMRLFFLLFFTLEALPILLKMIMGKDALTVEISIEILQHETTHQYEKLLALLKVRTDFENRMKALRDNTHEPQLTPAIV